MPRMRGAWEDVPIGVRLTVSEVAAIVGINEQSVINRLTENAPRTKPKGFRVQKVSPRVTLIIRDRVE